MAHTTTTPDDIFDARELPCETKRPAVIARCCQLPVGRSFLFLNSHDPVPLQFAWFPRRAEIPTNGNDHD